MKIDSITSTGILEKTQQLGAGKALQSELQRAGKAADASDPSTDQLREKFDEFVGKTFYGQLLSQMRKTVGKPAYFHGGRAEEVFRNQLDQVMAAELSEANASQFSDPMFELFSLSRS